MAIFARTFKTLAHPLRHAAWVTAAMACCAPWTAQAQDGDAAQVEASEKPNQPEKGEQPEKGDKGDKSDKPATATKGNRKTKGETKGSKAPRADAADKAEKPEKTEAAPVEIPLRSVPGRDETPVGDDATRLGPFQPPPRPFPFPLLGDDKAREVFVDRAGNLYKERPYSGNVPDWNAAPPVAAGSRCRVEAQDLQWVGFQNNADGSRVYVQLEKQACGYVYRPDDLHIVIDLPQVTVFANNLRREILTGAFPTAIEQIRAEEVPGKGTRVVVVLREKRPYLSAHLGKYLFVDVTR